MLRHQPESEPRDKFVGIWIRVSTEDQAKGDSPEHHERRARMYAESKSWHVREVYHLEAVSGKAVREHPETQRMMRDVAAGRISGLIFSKLARLARSTRDLLDFADYFREHEADLISLQESIDTTSPAGRLFYTLIAAMAQWEREEISDRVAASVPIRAKLGKPTGGQAPYGYQWHDRQLAPQPEEAAVRKRMYELFLEHRRKKVVARLLNEMGHRTRSGAKFSDTTVDRLLRDPLAKGLRRANYTKSLGEKKHWRFKPQNEWVFSKAEPIVSEELWDQVNAILDQQRQNGRRVAKRPVQLFAGFTYCTCGQKMYVPSDSPKYVCSKCRNKIPIADLEAVFHEQLKNFVFSPEEIAQYLKQADETIKTRGEQLETLSREEHRVRQEMDKVYRAYVDDEISVEGFGRTYRPLEERLKQLEEETPRLQGELDFLKIQYLSRDEILEEARDLHRRWPALGHEEKRQVVENIIDRITIGKDEVAIDLCYLPSSSEMAAKKQRNLRGSSPRPA